MASKTATKKLKKFDVSIIPQIEKMWLDFEIRDVEAPTEKEAIELALGRARKTLQKNLRLVAARKSPQRICIATMRADEVVDNGTKVIEGEDYDYNI